MNLIKTVKILFWKKKKKKSSCLFKFITTWK